MECQIHLEEPCGDNCSAVCESSWHHRPVMVGIEDQLCKECWRESAQAAGFERRDAAAYAYACGYHD